jgi:hypothetical protein
MSDNDREARSSCHALFNNGTFADAVFVADRIMSARDDGLVTTRLVSAELRVSDSVVRPVMMRLVAGGLLDELPKAGATNGPRLFHRRNPHRWTALLELIASTRQTRQSTDGQASADARDLIDRGR